MGPSNISSRVARLGWKVIGPIYRAPSHISDRMEYLRKANQCILATGAVLLPPSRIENNQAQESIRIGRESIISCKLATLGHGGSISVGADCVLAEDTYIWSAASITIGDRVMISHGVNIHDFISHSLSAKERYWHAKAIFSSGHPKELANVPSAPIVIEDDAWIGFGATILKGVTIGRGAVVGAQSVITKDVAPYTVVVGNPARIVGQSFE